MIGRIETLTADGDNQQHILTLFAQGDGIHWVIASLSVIYDGTPPSGDITVTGLDAVTAIPVLSGNSDKQFAGQSNFFFGLENTAVVITVPAGGVGVRSLVYVTALRLLTAHLEKLYFQS